VLTWGRSHEFGTDRILNCLVKNPVDLSIIVAGQLPTERLLHCVKLTGISGAPKSGHGFSPIENPTDCECQKALPVILPSVLTQSIGCFQVLDEAQMLEFRVSKSQIVTVKLSIGSHFAREQATTDRTVGKDEKLVFQRVRQNVCFDLALKDIVWRLGAMFLYS
jgi:hypothetical protein